MPPDTVSFPGGYDIMEIVAAIVCAERQHVEHPSVGETEAAIVERFLEDLTTRHSQGEIMGDPYRVRGQELLDERHSLLNSHLRFPWFALAYWSYGLIAVRSGISIAQFDGPHLFFQPIRGALRELGIDVSDDDVVAEIDRFIPAEATPKSVKTAASVFLSFVRFLHYGALRRRSTVTPRLVQPTVCLVFADDDASEAQRIGTFLTTHGVAMTQQPADATPTTPLLVILSRAALASEALWRSLADWMRRGASPMVVCLMSKQELYAQPPDDWRRDVWSWLAKSVAVELGPDVDRYLRLLSALDPQDAKQWWWNKGDALEAGFAADVFGLGIPRPPTRRADRAGGDPYPFAMDVRLLGGCDLARARAVREDKNSPDAKYVDLCDQLGALRRKPNGEPYTLPWFVMFYRGWLGLAQIRSVFAYSTEEHVQAEREMRAALFALGVGTDNGELSPFMNVLANLPWPATTAAVDAVDDRAIAFVALVWHFSQSALARTQRMRLRIPVAPAFVSYARPDEAFARELVAHVEAQGADVWWDMNALTLGSALDGSLRTAVSGSRYLLLVATPAAARSSYVRFEVEAALGYGLRVVAICPDGDVPSELRAVLDAAPASVEPVVTGAGRDRTQVAADVLARLAREPEQQLEWLCSQPVYQDLRQRLANGRARGDA